jgi:hypothetical protein
VRIKIPGRLARNTLKELILRIDQTPHPTLGSFCFQAFTEIDPSSIGPINYFNFHF